jgi:hypothetical protein
MPIYDPPQETQDLVPPSPLPSLVPKQSLLGLPTPYPKLYIAPKYEIPISSPRPSLTTGTGVVKYDPAYSYTLPLGNSLIVLPPAILLETNSTEIKLLTQIRQ